MSKRDSVAYTFAFAAAVCVVCAVFVSTAAVGLRDRQRANVELDRKKNVLMAAGILTESDAVTRETIERGFNSFEVTAVDLRTGKEDSEFDASRYDQRRALAAADSSRAAPDNAAQVRRLPNHALVYRQFADDGQLQLLVLPIEGMGLWGTMYGFLALGSDLNTIRGLTYYEHKETPGLGGEVDSPRWKQLWPGRMALDESGSPVVEVIRGQAGDAESDPHRVDGISGATITGRGVTDMIHFWLGESGYGPYLKGLRESVPAGDAGATTRSIRKEAAHG